jgi:hypothetical protein
MPPGVTVNEAGVLCDKQGMPLPHGLRLAPGGQGFVLGPKDTPLPKGMWYAILCFWYYFSVRGDVWCGQNL